MPGIAGMLTKQIVPDATQLLEVMLQSMMHEDFYTYASFADQAFGWYAGSVAIKGSFADCMPVHNETHTVTLFLAGECFIDIQTTTALKAKGHKVNPSNASSLIHLYEEEGPDFVKKLNGWFSGLILDAKRGKAVLFNDRYGMRRIYYYEDARGLYFASEAKALLRAVPALRRIEPESVAEYLCFDCVLNARSFFTGVHIFPAGTLWIYERGLVERRLYFDPIQLQDQRPLGIQQFLEQLTETFKEALARCLVGDKLSIALTGGLDTRLIMACLPRDRRHVRTFTFGGMYRDSMDVRRARAVSKACNIPHDIIRLDKDYLSDYPKHIARAVYVTDGLTDAISGDSLYMSHRARSVAPITVMGVYGSQVLGRIRRALRNRLPDSELINSDFRHYLADASLALRPFEHEHNLSYLLKREIPWYWSRFMVAQMSQLTIRSPYLDNDLVDLLYRVPPEGFDGSNFEVRAINMNNPNLMDIATNKGIGIIRMITRARSLGEKILDWDTLPHSLHHGVTRMDSLILSPLHLNKLFLGYEYFRHYNIWFRRELAPYLKEILLDDRTLSRPYWNAKRLRKIVNDHVNGRGRYLAEIRKTLTIELIHRTLVEGGE